MTSKPKTLDEIENKCCKIFDKVYLESEQRHDVNICYYCRSIEDVRAMLMERVKELENTPINKLHSQGVYDIPTIQKELLRIAGKETGK